MLVEIILRGATPMGFPVRIAAPCSGPVFFFRLVALLKHLLHSCLILDDKLYLAGLRVFCFFCSLGISTSECSFVAWVWVLLSSLGILWEVGPLAPIWAFSWSLLDKMPFACRSLWLCAILVQSSHDSLSGASRAWTVANEKPFAPGQLYFHVFSVTFSCEFLPRACFFFAQE